MAAVRSEYILEPEVDPNVDDSTLGSDTESTGSGSITSSINGYKYENGRRCADHAYREGSYYLPNDEAEQARLDLLHHIFCLALDGALFLAPVDKNIKRCLDFGTGTGIWAIDFADDHPNTEVIGTDLSPIQPSFVPPNLKFYVDDVEDEWSYRPDEAFDFVHGRSMGTSTWNKSFYLFYKCGWGVRSCGSIKSWDQLYRRIYDHLKPGGWLEMQEYDSEYQSDDDPTATNWPNVKEWIRLVNEASSQFGRPLNMARKQKQLMQVAGFVDIKEKILKIPMGSWAKGRRTKEMGTCNTTNTLECVDAFTLPLFTRVLGWTVEECEVLMAKLRIEIKDRRNHLYFLHYVVYGRKPEK